MNETLCPRCGRINEYANDDGYTDEAPREYHAECWRAARNSACFSPWFCVEVQAESPPFGDARWRVINLNTPGHRGGWWSRWAFSEPGSPTISLYSGCGHTVSPGSPGKLDLWCCDQSKWSREEILEAIARAKQSLGE